jgi:hypothetical protein
MHGIEAEEAQYSVSEPVINCSHGQEPLYKLKESPHDDRKIQSKNTSVVYTTYHDEPHFLPGLVP